MFEMRLLHAQAYFHSLSSCLPDKLIISLWRLFINLVLVFLFFSCDFFQLIATECGVSLCYVWAVSVVIIILRSMQFPAGGSVFISFKMKHLENIYIFKRSFQTFVREERSSLD